MKTIIKHLLALTVVVTLSILLSVLLLWGAYLLLILSLFYTDLMWLLTGSVALLVMLFIGKRVFTRHKVYTVEEGLHYEN